ncbi:DinB family protein [Paenibacillus sp. BK720]|uniref:DinB family protein n=1 Tax=Paenibacillus sp. BK720 TaxID=2587092 RepID=UPI0014205644|nr:DinB family protein [Paenibacillus sp. BK720]NIK70369.1 hypothetical protein [Paenibacillus sp. BK720]
MTQSIINTGKMLHQIVIGKLQGVTEGYYDKQPEGFNNTIRWNVGHIIFWMDKYCSLSFGTPSSIPSSYGELFNSGTSPLDWTMVPPSTEELAELLTAQFSRLSELTPEMLEKKLSAPYVFGPFQFDTAGELFNFALIHEAIHLGTISGQLQVLSR